MGWKRCYIGFRYGTQKLFDSCTTVHVKYEDEAGLLQRLDWVNDNERIHNLSHQKIKFPLYLLIKGTVMDMKLAWFAVPGWNGYSGGGWWIVISPSFLEGEKIRAPRCLFEDIQLQSGDDRASTYLTRKEEVNVLGMIMASIRVRGGYDMSVMILKPVTRLLNGQPETMYERAHLHQSDARSGYGGPRSTNIFRETVVRLC